MNNLFDMILFGYMVEWAVRLKYFVVIQWPIIITPNTFLHTDTERQAYASISVQMNTDHMTIDI